MGFGDSVQELLETFSKCLTLLSTFGSSHEKQTLSPPASTVSSTDGRSVLRRSLQADRAKVHRAYSSRLSQTGSRLELGDEKARSALRRIIDRLVSTLAGLLGSGSHSNTNTGSGGHANNYSSNSSGSWANGGQLDYGALRALSNASRADAIHAIDELSLRLGGGNRSGRRRVHNRASSRTMRTSASSASSASRPSTRSSTRSPPRPSSRSSAGSSTGSSTSSAKSLLPKQKKNNSNSNSNNNNNNNNQSQNSQNHRTQQQRQKKHHHKSSSQQQQQQQPDHSAKRSLVGVNNTTTNTNSSSGGNNNNGGGKARPQNVPANKKLQGNKTADKTAAAGKGEKRGTSSSPAPAAAPPNEPHRKRSGDANPKLAALPDMRPYNKHMSISSSSSGSTRLGEIPEKKLRRRNNNSQNGNSNGNSNDNDNSWDDVDGYNVRPTYPVRPFVQAPTEIKSKKSFWSKLRGSS